MQFMIVRAKLNKRYRLQNYRVNSVLADLLAKRANALLFPLFSFLDAVIFSLSLSLVLYVCVILTVSTSSHYVSIHQKMKMKMKKM